MPIVLDHTIVPARDNEAAAKFFARIFGLEYEGPWGHFAPVRVNETLTLDFSTEDRVESHHYAFHVTTTKFEEIFSRVKEEEIPYGSGPGGSYDMCIGSPIRAGAPSISAARTVIDSRS